jgi:MoaA/NifB/PqqE/SkfB family radical SAM enzyme
MLRGKVLQELLEDPPHRINISLYGGSNETYRKMCGQNAFDTVLENIHALKKAGVDIRLNVSITPHNRHDMAKIYEYSTKLDMHAKATSYMYPSIRVNGEQYGCGDRLDPLEAATCALDWDQLRMSKEAFNERARQLMNREATIDSECAADLEEGVRCRAGNSSFWMTWDGRMVPCGMLPYPVAHPLETGFAAAWEKVRTETAAIRLPKKCNSCPNRKMCCVCAAICLTETGSFDKCPEYICQMTEETIRQAIERSDIQ